MTNKVSRIVDHKAQTRAYLNKLRRAYLYAIYFGILNKKQWYEIHDKILKETIKYQKPTIDTSKMYMVATTILKESRGIPQDSTNTGLLLFLLLNGAYHWFKKPMNEIINTEENILKSEYLTNMINDARENKQIFYLCSRHNDCAKDHEDWQGKVYVDENWDRYDMDKGVLDFINGNQIHTLQWVIQGPVWMTSRRNCRHFFTPIKTEDAIKLDNKKLLTKYKMSFKTGYHGVDAKEQAAREKLEFYKQLYGVSKGKYILQKIHFYENYLQNRE